MALPWGYFFHPKIPWSYEPLQLVRGPVQISNHPLHMSNEKNPGWLGI